MPHPRAPNLCVTPHWLLARRATSLSLAVKAHVSLFSFLSILSHTWLSLDRAVSPLICADQPDGWVPTWTLSCPGRSLRLCWVIIITISSIRRTGSGCYPCRCSPTPQDPTTFLFWGWPTRKQERPGLYSMFAGSASRNESFPPLTRAARKQLFLPWWQVPSWPGRLVAQAPDSRGFFLSSPYPAPDPSPFLAPQAGSGPDTGITAQGCPRAAAELARMG